MNASPELRSPVQKWFLWTTGLQTGHRWIVVIALVLFFAAVSILLRSWQHALILFPAQWITIRMLQVLVRRASQLWLLVPMSCLFGGLVSTIGCGYFYLGSNLYVSIETPVWENRERREAIRDLLKSDSSRELESKVGHWGRFLNFPDGSWMAVWYNDTHAFLVASCVVTRDSDGKWLSGDYHFCGTFKNMARIAIRQAEDRKELETATDPNYRKVLLDSIGSRAREQPLLEATSAAEARQVLIDKFKLHEITPTPK